MSERPAGSRFAIVAMAVAAGATVANIFYNQPLLAEMGRSFGGGAALGLVATVTQFGYSLGVLLLVPLGDRVERRGLVSLLSLLTAGLLVGVGLAPNVIALAAASFAMGTVTIIPQLLVPFAAALAAPRDRGRAVGTVAAGILLGVLLSRTLAGWFGEQFGWRAVFLAAAAFMLVLSVLLRLLLPLQPKTTALGYGALLRSLWTLVVEEPTLRLHALLGALTFASFNAFWATLAAHLESLPGHYGPRVAGLFGLLGVVGAVAAPLVGRYSDRRGDRWVNAVAIVVLIASFVVLALGSESLAGIGIAAVLLDFGAQANHVSNQTRIVALREEARSRLNTIYMSTYVAGGALGSLAGTLLLRRFGYAGVCAAGATSAVLALVVLLGATARGRSASPAGPARGEQPS
jgi:predicted MFS family arabinose efflux permease